MTELTYCPALETPYLYSDKIKTGYRIIFKARCKMWTCEYCAGVNKRNHFKRILYGIDQLQNQGFKFSFVTVTSHERVRTFSGSYRVWKSAWKKLRQRAVRHEQSIEKGIFHYVYIPECHQDGTLHWHGLFSGSFTTRWWKDNARECGLGYECESIDIQDSFQGANYCLKYISKHMGQKIDIPRFRRINYSQKFPDQAVYGTSGDWLVAAPKVSIVSLIESAWSLDLGTVLHGKEITEILTED